jgi:nucleoside-diphosphate-sugar epimerase
MLEYFPIDRESFDGPVLITGAGGCIGSWALALLTHAGVPCAAFDLTEDKKRPRLLLSDNELTKVQWFTGDVSDADTVRKAIQASGARAIIHLAALQVPFCKADPLAGALVNVVGTVNIFQAARDLGIRRLAYASSIAAHGAIEGHGTMPTLYGAYKHCNEQTAKVYSNDWGVHSVGLRPGVVYGVGRDQGMTSKTTVALLAAAADQPYTIPFRGPISWLHAGEVASAFIRAVSQERTGAPVFDINGNATTVETALQTIQRLVPGARLSCSGEALPFPMDLSDEPVRSYLGDYGAIPLEAGMLGTYEAFRVLLERGALSKQAIA